MFSSVRNRFVSFADDQRRERLDQCIEIQLALDECLRVAARKERKEKENSKSNSDHNRRWNRFNRSSMNDSTQGQELNDDGGDEPKIKLEDTKEGMKISRFYGWGLVNPKAQAAIAEMREQSTSWQSMREVAEDNTKGDSTALSADESNSGNNDITKEPNAITATAKSDNFSSNCTRETHAIYACKALALGCGADLMEMKKCFVNELGTTNPSSIYYDSAQNNQSSSLSSTKCQLEQKKVGQCIRKNMEELNQRMETRSSQ